MSKQHISIFDTTLRDGEQAPGNSMDVATKVAIGKAMATLGVDVIEVGFPSSSKEDQEAAEKLGASVSPDVRLCVFARCRERDIRVAADTMRHRENWEMELLVPGSVSHAMRRGLHAKEAIDETIEYVHLAKQAGAPHVSVGLEDATRGSLDFLQEVIARAADAGAEKIVIADTVGCMLPNEFGSLVSAVVGFTREAGQTVAVHTHDDLGLATANAISAIINGAHEVQATICGLGERAGNAALEEIVGALIGHPNLSQKFSTKVNPALLPHVATLVSRYVDYPIPRNKAIIGRFVFSTEAGIHQAGMLRAADSYLFLDPGMFGREPEFIFGRHSGLHALYHLAKKFNWPDTMVEQAMGILKNSSYSIGELELLSRLTEGGI